MFAWNERIMVTQLVLPGYREALCSPEPVVPDWREAEVPTLTAAEELVDRLEGQGVRDTEVELLDETVLVRWR
jgi:hypothetical protein